MDKQQQAIYSEIIQALMDCTEGKEASIYDKYSDYLDENLIKKIQMEVKSREEAATYIPWLQHQEEIIRARMRNSRKELESQVTVKIFEEIGRLKHKGYSLEEIKEFHKAQPGPILSKSFPISNDDLANKLNHLTALYQLQGTLTEIKPFYNQALNIWRELYGDTPNADVAYSLYKIGVLFAAQKNWREAKYYYEKALNIWRELFRGSATYNRFIDLVLNKLGELYAAQGRWANAKPLYEEALAIRQELFGDTPDNDLATSLNNLGELYATQEQWVKAEPLYKKALAIRWELYRDNPNNDLATSLNNLGELYAAKGQWAEAKPFYEEALAIRQKLYGDNPNNDLVTSFNNLAILYRLQEQWAEAELFRKKALEIRQDLYGNLPNNEPIASVSNLSELCQSQGTITLGRDASATLQLDAPTVDRIQATITKDPSGRYILQDNSTNGVFVDGQRVDNKQIVSDGATIKINPFTLTLKGDELQLLDSGDQIRLDVEQLTLRRNGKYNLQQLSFAIKPGQFVALVGGSGAGKSTLMKTLLGINTPTSGAVYINGNNLRQNFDLYRNQIGYVPQDDVIHMDLTVEEVLTYSAKLRLPPDISSREIINQVLNDTQMTKLKKSLIRDLSGGQRKRVSIGVELLANPKLFFLDEPTSGLDPGLDKDMMKLLKNLAQNDGRTVILVTHATANITDCHRVVFLGNGGKLCYFGTPTEALTFFKVTDFADIYIKLREDTEVDRYVELYKNSSYFQKYIANNFRPNSNNKKAKISPRTKKANSISQWLTLTQRYFKLITRDRAYLKVALIVAPVSIVLMRLIQEREPFILGSKVDPGLPGAALQVLFVFTCVSLWVGLSNSLQEIVKESEIYSRERLVNLRLRSYLGSKVAVLATIAVVQTILITIFITLVFKSPISNLISWQIGIFITTFLTLTASFSLGLLVSATVKNSTQATSFLPLLLCKCPRG